MDALDQEVIANVAGILATPKQEPANSFVLHAPLELLARARLLPLVAPRARDAARARIRRLGEVYEASGDPVECPATAPAGTAEQAASALAAAIGAGEIDDVDVYATALADRASPSQVRRALGGTAVTSLAAAGHASILLDLLPQVSVPLHLIRGPLRELARNPDWRIRWLDDVAAPDRTSGPDGDLLDVLLRVPMLGLPGSDFIYPLMSQVDQSGVAEKLASGSIPASSASARRTLGRIAAWSMLQEPDYTPYGWTHCLTIPQAIMSLAGDPVDTWIAIAAAATHVIGFRAGLGSRPVVPAYQPPPPPTADLAEAIAAGPSMAAAAAWHSPDDGLVTHLATAASLHEDAHVVKYTLACLDAAGRDEGDRPLYLAAAASLLGWWGQQPLATSSGPSTR